MDAMGVEEFMSKLAHRNQETMEKIERDRRIEDGEIMEEPMTREQLVNELARFRDLYVAAEQRAAGMEAALNSPETENFVRGVYLEACHQVERWGTAHDRGKQPSDWFWLIGYLAGKALQAHVNGDTDKALHHCISSAAALCNWHAAIKGVDVRMCPGKSDIEKILSGAFGDATLSQPHGEKLL